jgi:uncharacterized membrane protein
MRKYLKGLCNKHIFASNFILGLVGLIVIPFAMPLHDVVEAAVYFITRIVVMGAYMKFVMGLKQKAALCESFWFSIVVFGVGFITVAFVNTITNNFVVATCIYTFLRIASYPLWAGREFR